jgi:hypothetical protein
MHKIVNKEIAIIIPAHMPKKKRCVTHQYHPKQFINIDSNNNYYKYSFFTRMVLTLKEVECSTSHSIINGHVMPF